MEIEILNTHKNDFSPVIGERTMELLSRFGQKLDEDGIDTLSSETIEILSHCTNPYKNEVQSVTNLVVGYVQSGKTMSFTTLSALAHDNGFRIIIYFAGTKNNLLSQTTKRLRKDLINGSANSAYYKLFENPTLEYAQRIRNALNISSKPTILITVLKHHKYISDLAAMFNSMQLKQTLGKAGVLIIDDEADQASLNGYAYKNSKSEEWEDDEYTTTYSSIMKLKGALANHSYIQYTATPQGPLLISIMDLLSPKHHTVLTPGKTYTGGKTFFCDEPGLIITIPEGEVFHSKHNNLADCPDSLVNALQLHLMGVAIIVKLLQKESFLSMMIHADRDQDASEKFYRCFNLPPQKTIQGLWAELFVISIASNPEYLLKAWHSSLNDVYDFNDGIDKIEVKSTSKSHRIHKFSYDQLSPTENTNLIISSIFVIQSGIGKNIFDLKEDIETQICSLELRYKLNEIIFRTLGSEFEKVYDVYFDYQQAVDSYKLIPAIYIPSLNSESIPNEITNIHFDCDLSQIDVPDNIAAIYPHSKLFSSL